MSRLQLVAVVVAAVLVGAPAGAVDSPPTSPGTATTETLGAVGGTEGWCFATSTAAADVWAAAPARITAAMKTRARFVTVTNIDTAINVCSRMGAASTGLTCDDGTGTAGRMVPGGHVALVIARDSVAQQPAHVGPGPLFVIAASGTPKVCVDIGF